MKKNGLFLFLISAILLFVTAFSFVVPQHAEECAHTTCCEYCTEIEQAEKSLLAIMETHGECFDSVCEDCSFVEEQQEILRIKKTENHSCREAICASCLHTAFFTRRLKTLFYAIIAFATLVIAVHLTRTVFVKKDVFAQFITLVTLKVKLTN